MLTLRKCLAFTVLFLCANFLGAQVPSMINYQGRIAVSGVNFTGTGQFRFALVNGAGTQTYWSNDGTSTAGSQPTAAVGIAVDSGIYSVRLGDTSLPNMAAVPATVFANSDVRLRVWFNDGVNGVQLMSPDQRITSVGYAMVAGNVPDGAITGAKIAAGAVGSAQIANGAVGSAQLAPGAVASGLQSANLSAVGAGGIIGSADPNNAALLAQGFVRDPAQLSTEDSWTILPGGDAVAGHTAVWTGTEMIFWGGVVPSSSAGPMSTVQAINRGVKFNPTSGVWTPISMTGAPQARFDHSAVWTGTEMIVFGGQTTGANGLSTVLNNGGRYNPATNTWSYLAPLATNPPDPMDNRRGHLAFWSGSKMLVWGGTSATGTFGSTMTFPVNTLGKIYDPVANTWSGMLEVPMEMTGGNSWAGVWTGTQMILWSRQQGSLTPPNAGRYTLATNTWSTLPAIPGDPALPDTAFTAVWSGSEMILWGGSIASITPSNLGYRFNPTTNVWTAMTLTSAPLARHSHSAAWVGSEMVVWGGKGAGSPAGPVLYNDGGRYNPTTNTWSGLSASTSPVHRQNHTFTAAGSNLVVWGGVQGNEMSGSFKFLKNGGNLTPSTGTWVALANGSPSPRGGHTMIWTGTEMIIWGGAVNTLSSSDLDPVFNDGARFNPSTGVWTALPSLNAPVGRFGHSAVWTGTEMIIWGGHGNTLAGGAGLNSGGRYNPTTNTWTATDTSAAPTPRGYHSAVWTGSKMIVWGGFTESLQKTNTGAQYSPVTNTWTPTSTTNIAQEGVSGHSAFWTGSEMLIWSSGSSAVSPNARYNPTTDSWIANAVNPMALTTGGTASPTALWTGTEILAGLGGMSGFQLFGYSPVADFWDTKASFGGISNSNSSFVSVWTGSEMIVVSPGSVGAVTSNSQAGRFSPASGTWSTINTTGAPVQAMGGAVWTGSEMLMWGGTLGTMSQPTSFVSDSGYRYRLPQNYYFYRRP